MGNADSNLGASRDISVAWLAIVYDRFSPAAYQLAVSLLGDATAAEDVLVKAFAHLARYRHECAAAHVPAALMALTRHFAIRDVRRRLGLPVTAALPPAFAGAWDADVTLVAASAATASLGAPVLPPMSWSLTGKAIG